MRKKVWGEIVLLLLLSLVPLLWFRDGQMLLGHDSGFRLAPLEHLKNIFYSWNPYINIGKDWSLYKAFLITQFPETLFSAITGSVLWGQRLALIGWFFTLGFGMWLGVYILFSDQKYRFLRLWSSIFAMFNFYVFQGWFIGERAKFSLFAALPIAIALFYRSIIQRKSIGINALYFGVLYFLLNGGGSPPLYGSTVMTLFICYVWFSIYAIRKNGRTEIKRCLTVGCAFLLSFIVLNFYWIFPQMHLYLTTYAQALGDNGGMEGLIAWEQGISKNASFINLLRLQGIPDWYDNTNNLFAKPFLTNPLLVFLSFVPAFITFVGSIFFVRGMVTQKVEKNYQLLIGLFLVLLVGLVLAAGSHPPFGFLFTWAMRHIPGFAIFRSSFYKFAPMVWIPIIMLSGYTLHRCILSIRSKTLALLISSVLLGYILAYHYPFFTKDVFTFMNPFSTRVSVPSYVNDMGQFVNTTTEKDARIAILPALDSGYYNVLLDTSSWGYFSLDILPRSVMSRGLIANDNDANQMITRLYESLRTNDRDRFIRIAETLGITYILWRDDAVYKNEYQDNRSIVWQKKNFLSWSFVEVKNIGLWTLYKIPASVAVSKIYIGSDIITAHGKDVSHADVFMAFAQNKETIVVDTIHASAATLLDTVSTMDVTQATCVACSQKERDAIDNGLSITDLTYAPGSILFKRKEYFEKTSLETATSIQSTIDAQIMIANTNLQKAKWNTLQNNLSESAVNFEDYTVLMKTVIEEISSLTGKIKNDYVIRILSFVQAQKHYVATMGIDENQKEVSKNIVAFEKTLRAESWLTTDTTTYKIEVEIPQTDAYTVHSAIPLHRVFIDSQSTSSGTVSLTEGYHKITVLNQDALLPTIENIYFVREKPSTKSSGQVRFTEIHPSSYSGEIMASSSPSTIVFNEQFDVRWKLLVDGKAIPEEYHIRANGYANAWVLELQDTHTFSIVYEPQRTFYIGGMVTMLGLLGGVGLIVYIQRKHTNSL
ncbi:MAG: hypothetical protein WAV51_02790 [Microgenomates group bacterium]